MSGTTVQGIVALFLAAASAATIQSQPQSENKSKDKKIPHSTTDRRLCGRFKTNETWPPKSPNGQQSRGVVFGVFLGLPVSSASVGCMESVLCDMQPIWTAELPHSHKKHSLRGFQISCLTEHAASKKSTV